MQAARLPASTGVPRGHQVPRDGKDSLTQRRSVRYWGVTALGDTLEEALNRAYAGVEKISFEGAMYAWKDIGRTPPELIDGWSHNEKIIVKNCREPLAIGRGFVV